VTDELTRPAAVAGSGTEYGDRDEALGGEILRTLVGSQVHGLDLAGVADRDEMGVFVERPERVVGMAPALDRYVYRTQPEGGRSGPGDVDLVMYSLRRYLRLATTGNPTALLPLYAPADTVVTLTPLGAQLRALAPSVLSQQAVHRFLGYLQAQLDRLLGVGSRRGMPHRPELVAAHGYDTKYASHALRLALQGLELARDGRLTLPMPAPERDEVLAVKRGEVPRLVEVVTRVEAVRAEVERLLAAGTTPLPPEPDLAAVSAWSIHAHRSHWGW
jgi:uncharacterized protein